VSLSTVSSSTQAVNISIIQALQTSTALAEVLDATLQIGYLTNTVLTQSVNTIVNIVRATDRVIRFGIDAVTQQVPFSLDSPRDIERTVKDTDRKLTLER
jgi:hypothetical protein